MNVFDRKGLVSVILTSTQKWNHVEGQIESEMKSWKYNISIIHDKNEKILLLLLSNTWSNLKDTKMCGGMPLDIFQNRKLVMFLLKYLSLSYTGNICVCEISVVKKSD